MEKGKEAEKRRVCFPKKTHAGFPVRREVLGKNHTEERSQAGGERGSVFEGGERNQDWNLGKVLKIRSAGA